LNKKPVFSVEHKTNYGTSLISLQCLSIVNEYYAPIYDFLVNSLNAGEVCKLFGLCGAPGIKGKVHLEYLHIDLGVGGDTVGCCAVEAGKSLVQFLMRSWGICH
jgi:hypothetical protein